MYLKVIAIASSYIASSVKYNHANVKQTLPKKEAHRLIFINQLLRFVISNY
jgi:hypothetical protein